MRTDLILLEPRELLYAINIRCLNYKQREFAFNSIINGSDYKLKKDLLLVKLTELEQNIVINNPSFSYIIDSYLINSLLSLGYNELITLAAIKNDRFVFINITTIYDKLEIFKKIKLPSVFDVVLNLYTNIDLNEFVLLLDKTIIEHVIENHLDKLSSDTLLEMSIKNINIKLKIIDTLNKTIDSKAIVTKTMIGSRALIKEINTGITFTDRESAYFVLMNRESNKKQFCKEIYTNIIDDYIVDDLIEKNPCYLSKQDMLIIAINSNSEHMTSIMCDKIKNSLDLVPIPLLEESLKSNKVEIINIVLKQLLHTNPSIITKTIMTHYNKNIKLHVLHKFKDFITDSDLRKIGNKMLAFRSDATSILHKRENKK